MTKVTALHNFVTRLWYGRSPLVLLLLPFALLYWVGSSLRRAAYQHDWLKRPEQSVPVIVVGNITAGGSGKTPVVAWLAQELQARGWRPALVSRGYGGAEPSQPLVVDDSATAGVVGDEPLLLRRLTGCPVVVCRDRAAAVELAARSGADVVIADDGLQHYRLRRTVEFAVIDGERRLGNGWLLPAGPLREGAGRLREVDAVLINGAEGEGVRFDLRQHDAVSMQDASRRPLQAFTAGVWSVAGIGNPQRFHNALRAAGLTVHPVTVDDHGMTDLRRLVQDKSMPVLMTEKDAMKYDLAGDIDAWYVPVSLEMAAADAAALFELVAQRIGPHPGSQPG